MSPDRSFAKVVHTFIILPYSVWKPYWVSKNAQSPRGATYTLFCNHSPPKKQGGHPQATQLQGNHPAAPGAPKRPRASGVQWPSWSWIESNVRPAPSAVAWHSHGGQWPTFDGCPFKRKGPSGSKGTLKASWGKWSETCSPFRCLRICLLGRDGFAALGSSVLSMWIRFIRACFIYGFTVALMWRRVVFAMDGFKDGFVVVFNWSWWIYGCSDTCDDRQISQHCKEV